MMMRRQRTVLSMSWILLQNKKSQITLERDIAGHDLSDNIVIEKDTVNCAKNTVNCAEGIYKCFYLLYFLWEGK